MEITIFIKILNGMFFNIFMLKEIDLTVSLKNESFCCSILKHTEHLPLIGRQ